MRIMRSEKNEIPATKWKRVEWKMLVGLSRYHVYLLSLGIYKQFKKKIYTAWDKIKWKPILTVLGALFDLSLWNQLGNIFFSVLFLYADKCIYLIHSNKINKIDGGKRKFGKEN